MKKFILNKKKLLLGSGALALLVATPTILTSCSTIDQTLIDKTFNKADGTNFADNYSISSVANKALKSDAGAKAMAADVSNQLILDWFERLSKESGQENTKRILDEQKKAVDNEYNDKVKASTDTNGANHELKFQQDELDPNGGTEASWKRKKMLDWAKSEFSTRLFEKDYLAVTKSDGSAATYQPTKEQVIKSIKGDGYKFDFTENVITNGNKNPYADKEYAKFQKFIFDQWVQIETPYIISMSLWKYGAPQEGLNSVYNKDLTGVSDKTSAGTYTFPYFSANGTSNSNGGTITKFTNFVNDAKTQENYYSNNSTEKELGIRKIDKGYTEDSSTLIFAKNGSIYNDLYIEFAAASSYLLNELTSKTTNKAATNKPFEKNVETTAKDGLDAILSNFVSKTASTSNNPSEIKIKNSLFKEMINPNGSLKGLINTTQQPSTPPTKAQDNNVAASDIYTIDAFRADSNSKLNDFMFIRDEAGVHAIAIDGQKHIQSGTTTEESKKKAGEIVLYHYFLSKITDKKEGVDIDIKTELSSFFTNNADYLITKYIADNKEQKIFNTSILDGGLLSLYNVYGKYSLELSRIDKVKEYNDKMITQKQTYANNYGIDTKKNGLASGWVFNKTNNLYDVANTIKYKDQRNPYETNGTYSQYLTQVDNYMSNLNLRPLTSNFSGFKYSQYIYSDNDTINAVLTSYGSDSNSMGDSMKIDILQNYLKDDFDLSTLKFKTTAFGNKKGSELDTALINNFYSSTFNGLTNKWSQYPNGSTDKNGNFDLTKLNNYKFWLYQQTTYTKTNAAITSDLSLLTLVSTAKYLLQDNGKEFLNYLKTKIAVGTDAYVAWVNTYNSDLTNITTSNTNGANTTTYNKVSDLLDVKNMQQNVNNSYSSVYTGMRNSASGNTGKNNQPAATNGTLIDLEKNNTNSFITTDAANYYNVVDNKLGYMGLITKDSTINSTAIKTRLFDDPTVDNPNKKGVLFSYGSRQELKDLIDSYTYESEITTLTNDLMVKTKAFDAGQIFESATDVNQKKEILKKIVDDTTKFTEDMFKRRDNYVGQQPSSTTTPKATAANNADVVPVSDTGNGQNIKSGAFVYQINNSDLKDWNSFTKVFDSTTNGNTKATNKNDIIYNLLFTAAADTNIQTNALTTILQDRKLTVYDSRLNTQLGPKWLTNWQS